MGNALSSRPARRRRVALALSAIILGCAGAERRVPPALARAEEPGAFGFTRRMTVDEASSVAALEEGMFDPTRPETREFLARRVPAPVPPLEEHFLRFGPNGLCAVGGSADVAGEPAAEALFDQFAAALTERHGPPSVSRQGGRLRSLWSERQGPGTGIMLLVNEGPLGASLVLLYVWPDGEGCPDVRPPHEG
jgi:hypothetical protein